MNENMPYHMSFEFPLQVVVLIKCLLLFINYLQFNFSIFFPWDMIILISSYIIDFPFYFVYYELQLLLL